VLTIPVSGDHPKFSGFPLSDQIPEGQISPGNGIDSVYFLQSHAAALRTRNSSLL